MDGSLNHIGLLNDTSRWSWQSKQIGLLHLLEQKSRAKHKKLEEMDFKLNFEVEVESDTVN